jgi:Flp pilus assembly pilin Flp
LSDDYLVKAVHRFLRDEGGQDLIEYTLLMAFIAMASAAIFAKAGSSVNGVWTGANTVLHNALVASS